MSGKEKAIARTKAQAVLLAVETSHELLCDAFKSQKPAMDQLKKIGRWIDECWIKTKRGKAISSGAMRDLKKYASKVDEIRDSVLEGCTTPKDWAAWIVALDGLIVDVFSSWEEVPRMEWRRLMQTWDKWCRAFLLSVDDKDYAHENGYAIYDKVETAIGLKNI